MTRVELRRGTAPVLVLALAVASGVLLWGRPDEWHARWMGLAFTFRNDLVELVPIALAAGAWHGGRGRRTGVGELWATTARPRWQTGSPAVLALVLAALTAAAGLLAVGAVLVAPGASWVGAGWIAVVATGLLALAGGVVLGVALGQAIGSTIGAPLVFLLSFLLLTFLNGNGTGRAALLSPGLEPPSFDALQLTGRAVAVQLVWFAALAAGALGLVAAATWRGRVLSTGLVVVGAAVQLLAGGTARLVPDARAAAPVCADGTPRVCVAAVHAAALPSVAGPGRRTLQRLGDRLGGRWELVEATDPGAAARTLQRSSRRIPFVISGFDLARDGSFEGAAGLPVQLAAGLGTNGYAAPGTGSTLAQTTAGALFTAWLLDRPVDAAGAGLTSEQDAAAAAEARRLLQRLRSLPPAAQTARMAAIRAAFLADRPDPLRPLR